ncbi:PHD-zinc-finger like domain-containing protein [Cristinia sonorae]|uniref:PHD-zinc-finger like domain-containing protein n=1 Tax=Cristinia sonorae TaxID=1940300 RepID=A0A8K0US65_9AGAR|nr:PHD-zinc-finger like domain-containing protein [Cristinia sonorae]
MAPRGASPAPTPLPKVSFVKVEDDYSKHPKGVHDQQARSYGYNEVNAEFQRPDHYIRYIEPLESDLAVQVEYDMDEQDQAWLDAVNTERKKEHIDKITYETFEIVMDRLEKEWFDLTKNIPKSDFALPSEDSTCAICDDSEGENTNAIVFCDGCNLAVHQDCYGVPYIPEGQWLCRKCTVFPESPVSCILCPNEGGAFKQTVQGEWVHLLCAIWVPETRVANEVFMEPVTGVERISKQRWKLKCDVCGVREGACIQCNKTSCFLAFHATCARKERLLMPMKATQGSEAPTLSCYCEKHLPKEQADIRAAALEAEQNAAEDDEDVENGGTKSPKLSKTARAYAKTYKPGPPIVPHIIVRRILQYISKINIRHKEKFVLLVCKYWSLKREVRRGAPLLKRLHLEPWTANSGGRAHTDEDKAIKLEASGNPLPAQTVLKRLRDDLERVRVLTHTTRKREKYKLRQVEAIRDVLSLIVSPHEAPLRMAFERIMVADRQDFFKNPVSKFDVPDYYDVIKNPMCWSNIDQKLDAHEYWDLKDFKDDVNLVLSNAMTYNKKATTFYKAAERIQNAANTILADLEEKLLQKRPEADPLPAAEASTPPAEEAESELGTLEPPLPLLELLAVEDSIKDGTKLVLSGSPLTSLFSFELPVFKPPPPPPPPKSKKPTRSEILVAKRRQRKADLDSSPGFRAPRTRNARAQAAAFEAEATGAGTSSPVQVAASLEEPEPSLEEEGTRRRHKPKAVLPGQTEEVPLMDDVDDQDSFKLFNDGWVLPPDRKRHNRPPVEKKPAPPPRKRHRAEREKSHLSTFSTSALENETLQTPSVSALDLPDTGVQPAAQAAPFKPPQSDARNALVPQNDETDNMEVDVVGLPEADEEEDDDEPPKIIIIETLDTPETRREKNRQRKEERLRLREAVERMTGPPTEDAEAEEDAQSELSALSEISDDGMNEEAEVEPPEPEEPKELGEVQVQEDGSIEGGTLGESVPSQRPRVCRSPGSYDLLFAESWPWWPAVVYERDDAEIPKKILKQMGKYEQNTQKRLYLVRFFDKKRNWQWLESNKLLELGEHDELDQDMMASNSKRQRWRNGNDRAACRAAWRCVCLS